MKFEYYAGEQRTPEWFEIRRGKPSASRLGDWLDVSKAKGKEGKPLKKRLDYEKELMFERQFNRNFEIFVSSAMQNGIDLEEFAAEQYSKITGNEVFHAGTYYNEFFAASPDGHVLDKKEKQGIIPGLVANGLLEIKVVKDNTFMEILSAGVPKKHWYQQQGQMWSSGLKWCDYAALNKNTGKLAIIRTEADEEFHKYLELSVQEKLVVDKFDDSILHDLIDPVPAIDFNTAIEIDHSDSNINF